MREEFFSIKTIAMNRSTHNYLPNNVHNYALVGTDEADCRAKPCNAMPEQINHYINATLCMFLNSPLIVLEFNDAEPVTVAWFQKLK